VWARQIGSVALVADGYHARVDGWTSLAVLLGAIGVWAGYPLADPIVGLLISAAIFVIVWQSARAAMVRMLDGVDPETLETIGHAARHVPRVEEVTDLRARWIGHRLHAEVSITVPGGCRWETVTISRRRSATSSSTTCRTSAESWCTSIPMGREGSSTTGCLSTRTTASPRTLTTERSGPPVR
jgi:cation diffusion facilitator family transporter